MAVDLGYSTYQDVGQEAGVRNRGQGGPLPRPHTSHIRCSDGPLQQASTLYFITLCVPGITTSFTLIPTLSQQASTLYFIIFGVPGIVVGIYALAMLSWSEL